jgi:competence protein ComEC
MLAVPLSTIILFGEIVLLMLSWIPTLANGMGYLLGWLIQLINNAILYFDGLSFAVCEPIFASVFSTWVLYALLITSCSYWLQKNRKDGWASIGLLLLFLGLQVQKQVEVNAQKTMIVYNVSGKQAVDFIVQDRYLFMGDSSFKADASLQQFHLKPARTLLLASKEVSTLNGLAKNGVGWQFYDKSIWLIADSIAVPDSLLPQQLDVLILSKNAPVLLTDFIQITQPQWVVIDASNSLWKTAQWKKECDALNLRFHSVAEAGAFVMKVHSNQ